VVDRSLRRILRSTGPDYDDLVQAAFERIITVLSRKPLGGSCELRAWSAAVTSHVALDWLRRRVRERRLFWSPLARPTDSSPPAPELDSSTSVDAERRLIARAEVGRVQGILARMKPAAAQTLLLHDVLGFDMLEVTEITGVSLSAAQSRLVRARKEFLRRAQAELPGFAGGTAQGGRATRLGGSEP
jgi:RNA polymerase sigma-70 factor, ECF subfamily